jgi:hypothetical protein
MSDSLPRPLPSINALRAHLKLLERGVNDARTKRVGPTPSPHAARVNAAFPGTRPTPVAQAAQRPIPPTFRLPPRPASDKPRAKAKGSTDFAAFFEDVRRRAAS